MELLSFDELNNLGRERRSLPYIQYFSEMELSDMQIKNRIKFAEDIERIILYIMSLILVMIESEEVDVEYLTEELVDRYLVVFLEYGDYDNLIDEYIALAASEIITNTVRNLDDEYFLSMDRVVYISENEANSCLNYVEYMEAVNKGKTKKSWIDVRDKKERKTHLEVGGKTIPINEPFKVGNSLMMFPKDRSMGADAKEIVNCRCTIKYV